MNLLVTGATGFIGRNVVAQLSARYQIFILARDWIPTLENVKCTIISMDLAGPIDKRVLPERIDTILHLAQANVPFPEAADEMFSVNTDSTLQLLDYARRVAARRFILASTGDVYGRRLGPCKETDVVSPATFYATTKRASEMLAESYSDYVEPCILRFFQPFGPGQSNRLIPRVADLIRQRKAIQLHKDDRPNFTPIYIDDAVHAIERAIDSSYRGAVNVAGTEVVNMRDLAKEIGRIIECPPIFEERCDEVGDSIGNNELMKAVLGVQPAVMLSEGLSRALKPREVRDVRASSDFHRRSGDE